MEMSQDIHGAFFVDPNDFQPNLVSGVFDQFSAPGVDGVTTYSQTLGGRQTKITARVLGYNIGSQAKPARAAIDETRDFLCRLFSPKNVGRLTIENGNGRFWIDCIPQSIPTFGVEEGWTLEFSVDFASDDPYWRREETHSIVIGDTTPLTTYRSSLPREAGVIHSWSASVVNACGMDIYPTIQFWPCNSVLTLVNETTGKRVALNQRVGAGFRVDVNTDPRDNSVTLYRQDEETGLYTQIKDVLYWLSVDSDLDFSLAPGGNVLSTENIVAGVYPAATVIWNDIVLGV